MNTFVILLIYTAVARTFADERVKIGVYYESLCPESAFFINNQLSRAYDEILDIMDLKLIPFGKANYSKNLSGKIWNFECQHGEDECYGNMIHNCFIDYYPKIQENFKFLNCCMTNLLSPTLGTAITCLESFNISLKPILDCIENTKYASDLLYKSGIATRILDPKLEYAPWIVVNDLHTEQIQNEAETDLIKLVCRTYKGSKMPKICNASQTDNYLIVTNGESKMQSFRTIIIFGIAYFKFFYLNYPFL